MNLAVADNKKWPELNPTALLILAELKKQMPFLYKATTEDVRSSFSNRIKEFNFIAERLAEMFEGDAEWIPSIVKSYNVLSLEFLKLQKKLEETGRYLLSSEREAFEQVYDNKNVFGAYYLPGLLLSEVFWPNHFHMNEEFKKDFLTKLPANASILEVGVGSGYHLSHMLGAIENLSYVGQDISTYAIEFAKNFIQVKKHPEYNLDFKIGNISEKAAVPNDSMDAIVMGEVLEHVEDPVGVLNNLYKATKPGGWGFVTTVVFAANIDHIYMFETVEEIREHYARTDWELISDSAFTVYPQDTIGMRCRPMNYSSILRKPV